MISGIMTGSIIQESLIPEVVLLAPTVAVSASRHSDASVCCPEWPGSALRFPSKFLCRTIDRESHLLLDLEGAAIVLSEVSQDLPDAALRIVQTENLLATVLPRSPCISSSFRPG